MKIEAQRKELDTSCRNILTDQHDNFIESLEEIEKCENVQNVKKIKKSLFEVELNNYTVSVRESKIRTFAGVCYVLEVI